MIRRLLIAILGVGVLAGCSYAQPDTSSVGLSYVGGTTENKTFNMCVPPGALEREDSGGATYYYPAQSSVITYDFSNRQGAESGPILVSTKDNQEMVQSGTINLRLLTSCEQFADPPELGGRVWKGGQLEKFHVNIGQRNAAFFTEDSSQIPPGWLSVLSKFVGAPAERAMDQKGGEYSWRTLYSDAATQKAFGEKVTAELPERIKSSTGGVMYFELISVELDKPTIPDTLRNQLVEAERAQIEQGSAEQKRAFQAQWPGGEAAYQAFQRREAEIDCIRQGRCPVVIPGTFPVPAMPAGS